MAPVVGMTEERWRDCCEVHLMLDYLEHQPGGLSRRKRLLFGLACLRRIESLLSDPRSRQCLALIELSADGQVLDAALDENRRSAVPLPSAVEGNVAPEKLARIRGQWALDRLAAREVIVACNYAVSASVVNRDRSAAPWKEVANAEAAHQCVLLRDLFGNPFHPGRIATAWRTPDVLALAQSVYEEGAFDRLPILADALEEAGCDDAQVLTHCREQTGHVKGCWVVDVVLGKA